MADIVRESRDIWAKSELFGGLDARMTAMQQNVDFIKVVGDGKALGYLDGRPCFCVGPLPGEQAEIEVSKTRSKYIEANLGSITQASPHRQAAQEAHYLSCSPWQSVDYAYQLELKSHMLSEAVGRPGLGLEVAAMVPAPQPLGYRNKLEFALVSDADKQVQLAVYARGTDTPVPVPEGCVLGSALMNAAALAVVEQINQLNVSGYVQSLTMRQSQTDGKIVAVLGLHQRAKRDWSRLKLPELAGVVVSRVRPGHRHETIWWSGDTEIHETVGGVALRFPYDSFSQVNLPAFAGALERIQAAIPDTARVADLYGGAGTIGLPLAARVRSVLGIELDPTAVELANATAAELGLANYLAKSIAAERLDATMLKDIEVIIVDPPRAGLHGRVVDVLLETKAQTIVYLSCNPVTQARDLLALAQDYQAGPASGFDFYPGTLHLESLVILTRR